MFSVLETIAVIAIIIAQLVIAYRTYGQIKKLNSFLPGGKNSLSLQEYKIPSDEILNLEPRDVIGKIKYKPSQDEDDAEHIDTIPLRRAYSVKDGDITINSDGSYTVEDL